MSYSLTALLLIQLEKAGIPGATVGDLARDLAMSELEVRVRLEALAAEQLVRIARDAETLEIVAAQANAPSWIGVDLAKSGPDITTFEVRTR